MRIAAASDLHGAYRQVVVPPADVLVIAGDITGSGTLAQVADFGAWLAQQPHAAKIVVGGNHDVAMQDSERETRRLLGDAIYLCDQSVEVRGRRFYGSPWIRRYRGAFNDSPAGLARRWASIPADTDILITHMPPHGRRDDGSDGTPHGDPGLSARIANLRLEAHVFGHVHEGYGRETAGRTVFANVAIHNRTGPPNAVTLIDLPS